MIRLTCLLLAALACSKAGPTCPNPTSGEFVSHAGSLAYARSAVVSNGELWADDSFAIVAVPLDGGAVRTLTAQPDGFGETSTVTLTADEIIWANAAGGGPDAGTIRAVSRDGGTVRTVAPGFSFTVFADADYVYWATPPDPSVRPSPVLGAIHRAPLDGGPGATLLQGPVVFGLIGLDATKLILTEGATSQGTLESIAPDGSQTVIVDPVPACCFKLAGSDVTWLDGAQPPALQRTNLASGKTVRIRTAAEQPFDLFVDDAGGVTVASHCGTVPGDDGPRPGDCTIGLYDLLSGTQLACNSGAVLAMDDQFVYWRLQQSDGGLDLYRLHRELRPLRPTLSTTASTPMLALVKPN